MFPLELIHSDICGLMNVRVRHGAQYFITFIDDFTQFGHIYLISHRFKALDCFKRYSTLVENQLNTKIKSLRTDRGREYLSDLFKAYCDEKGIARQLSILYMLQQNGVAERRNRTLLDMVRSMMAQANLPISFWGDTLMTATYILNRVPSKSIPSTLYEVWKGATPDLNVMRPWGRAAYVHNVSHEYGKLGPKGKKCVFIRYPESSKGYIFLGEDINGSVIEIESRDVVFLEEDFLGRGKIDRDTHFYEMEDPKVSEGVRIIDSTLTKPNNIVSLTPLEVSGSDNLLDHVPMERDHEQSQPRCSNRERIPRRRFEIEGEAFMISHDDEEPKTIQQAFSGPNSKEWFEAMIEEMNSMESNIDLIDLSASRKTIRNKWVINIKHRTDGTIDRYKARLVAKGYTQQDGIHDYEETFSPMVRFASIRLILAIVARMDLELHQMGVKTAFLNGELDEEIYKDQPLGFELKGQERKVFKLKRSIYDLKQTSRQWNLKFHQAMLKYGFTMMEEDHFVYIKRSNNHLIILSLYVDDILIVGNDKQLIDVTKK